MLKSLLNITPKFLKKRIMVKFLKDQKINFNAYYGFEIDGRVVKDFNIHIRHISNGIIDNFEDIKTIYQQKDILLDNIDKECAKDELSSEALFCSHKRALREQEHLKNIILKICNFLDKCSELKLDPAEAMKFSI